MYNAIFRYYKIFFYFESIKKAVKTVDWVKVTLHLKCRMQQIISVFLQLTGNQTGL